MSPDKLAFFRISSLITVLLDEFESIWERDLRCLLYLTDFHHFQEYKTPFTYYNYFKKEWGPVPESFDVTLQVLKQHKIYEEVFLNSRYYLKRTSKGRQCKKLLYYTYDFWDLSTLKKILSSYCIPPYTENQIMLTLQQFPEWQEIDTEIICWDSSKDK